MGRWHRYWFADGGRLAAACVRIGIALAVLQTLGRLAVLSAVDLSEPFETYRAVGIWMIRGNAAPPPGLIVALWVVAWSGSVAMLLGLFTRTATVLSFIGTVALAALAYSANSSWSHQYNVVLLAQLAFFGARGGDVLALDAWLRARRGLPPLDVPGGYQWSVRLVQLAIALFVASAVFLKLANGGFTLGWALSDSLRNHLVIRYDLAMLERPAIVDWLLAEVWRYRTAAIANLLAQLAPLVACVCVGRPRIRALCGAVFVCDVLCLGFVAGLWNEHWIPLAFAFVDWDRFEAWLQGEPEPPRRVVEIPRLQLHLWIAVFLAYQLVTSFVPRLDQRLNTYPFSSFPMFSSLRAREPLDEHLPYRIGGDHFAVTSDHPLAADEQRWFDYANRGMFSIRNRDKLEYWMRAVLTMARERYPSRGIRGIRHYLTFYEVPAYPAPARLAATAVAITGEITSDGTFHSRLGRLRSRDLRLGEQAGVTARLVAFLEDSPERHLLGFRRDALDWFTLDSFVPSPAYIVVEDAGEAWLVATAR